MFTKPIDYPNIKELISTPTIKQISKTLDSQMSMFAELSSQFQKQVQSERDLPTNISPIKNIIQQIQEKTELSQLFILLDKLNELTSASPDECAASITEDPKSSTEPSSESTPEILQTIDKMKQTLTAICFTSQLLEEATKIHTNSEIQQDTINKTAEPHNTALNQNKSEILKTLENFSTEFGELQQLILNYCIAIRTQHQQTKQKECQEAHNQALKHTASTEALTNLNTRKSQENKISG